MIAVVPARVGSQRVPFKNLCKINGKPLFLIPVEFGLEMGFEVVVTSDSPTILEESEKAGARPFFSGTHSNYSTGEDVWKEVT
ncbi:MAG: cytidylyltransferase domain-containing protein, partial [Candidatus Kariarchaeaceae archaeon]